MPLDEEGSCDYPGYEKIFLLSAQKFWKISFNIVSDPGILIFSVFKRNLRALNMGLQKKKKFVARNFTFFSAKFRGHSGASPMLPPNPTPHPKAQESALPDTLYLPPSSIQMW